MLQLTEYVAAEPFALMETCPVPTPKHVSSPNEVIEKRLAGLTFQVAEAVTSTGSAFPEVALA